jgi:hypothetical protein
MTGFKCDCARCRGRHLPVPRYDLTQAPRLAAVLREYIDGCDVCGGKGYVRYRPTERINRDDYGERSCSACSTRRDRGRAALRAWEPTVQPSAPISGVHDHEEG